MKRLIISLLTLFLGCSDILWAGPIKESKTDTPIEFYTAPSGVITKAATITATGQLQTTGVYQAPNGTASAPAFGFSSSGNTDNGMYLGASDQLRFSTAGSDRMTIMSTGQVGIGTTSPSSYLGDFVIKNDAGAHLSCISDSTHSASIYFGDGTAGDASYRGWVQYDNNVDKLYLGTAASTRMTITGAGWVGIGATSPGSLGDGGDPLYFHVHKPIVSSTNGAVLALTSQNTTDGTTFGSIDFGTLGTASSDKRGAIIYSRSEGSSTTTVSGGLSFGTFNAGSFATAMHIDKNQKVGIGTVSPAAIEGNYLTVAANRPRIVLSHNSGYNAGSYVMFQTASDQNYYGWYTGIYSGNELAFGLLGTYGGLTVAAPLVTFNYNGNASFSGNVSSGGNSDGIKWKRFTGTTNASGNIDAFATGLASSQMVGFHATVLWNGTTAYDVSGPGTPYTEAALLNTGNFYVTGSPGGSYANRTYRVVIFYW